MAATYGFHLCLNHPFFDGNIRIALIATVHDPIITVHASGAGH